MTTVLKLLAKDRYRLQLENAIDSLLESEHASHIPGLERVVYNLARLWKPSTEPRKGPSLKGVCVDAIYRLGLADFRVPVELGRGLAVPMWQFSKKPVARLEEVYSAPHSTLKAVLDRAPRIQVGTRCCGATIVDFDLKRPLDANARFSLALSLAGLAVVLAKRARYVYVYPTWRGAHVYLARDMCYVYPVGRPKNVKVTVEGDGMTIEIGRDMINVTSGPRVLGDYFDLFHELWGILVEVEKRLYFRERGYAHQVCETLKKCIDNQDRVVDWMWKNVKAFEAEAVVELKSDHSFLLKYPPSSMYMGYEGSAPVGWNGSILFSVGFDAGYRPFILPVSWTGAYLELLGDGEPATGAGFVPGPGLYAKMFLLRLVNFLFGDSRVAEIHGLVKPGEAERIAKFRKMLTEILYDAGAGEAIEDLLGLGRGEKPVSIDVCLSWAVGPTATASSGGGASRPGVAPVSMGKARSLMGLVREGFEKGVLCLYPLLAKGVREGERFKHLVAGYDVFSKLMLEVTYDGMVDFCRELTGYWGQAGWVKECVTKLKSLFRQVDSGRWVPRMYNMYKFYEDIAYFPCPFCGYKSECFEAVKSEVWRQYGYILDFDHDKCVEVPTVYGPVRACRLRIVPGPEDPRVESKIVWRLRRASADILARVVLESKARRLEERLLG